MHADITDYIHADKDYRTTAILPSSRIRPCISFMNPARPPNSFFRNLSISSVSCSVFSLASSVANRTARDDSRSSALSSIAFRAAARASSELWDSCRGVCGSRLMGGERRDEGRLGGDLY